MHVCFAIKYFHLEQSAFKTLLKQLGKAIMDRRLTLQPHSLSLSQSFLNNPLKNSLPFSKLPKLRQKNVSVSSASFKADMAVASKKQHVLEGVSEELNLIASQNLDHAPARRMVRSAFIELQQQLDHVLFKMAPTGIRIEEWYEINSKGQEIFSKSWLPEQGVKIKGAVCFCHGYGDTCTFFFEGIAKHIAKAGYAVYAIDHPGFGLSGGLHGYIPSFDDLADNITENYEKVKRRPEVRGKKFFILGQSMGGAVTLKSHLKEPNGWDGIVLVAPMCKIADDVTPPELVVKAVTCMSKLIPTAKLVPENDFENLTLRDPIKKKVAKYNVISYKGKARLKTAVELLKATIDIQNQVKKVSAPMLIIHGAADRITDPSVSQFLYDNASSKDKTLKLYEEAYHSILEGEPDERIYTVLNDIIAWLDSRCL